MMQCQICGDTQGPFELEENIKKKKVKLVCEDCAKKLRKERKKMERKEKKIPLYHTCV